MLNAKQILLLLSSLRPVYPTSAFRFAEEGGYSCFAGVVVCALQ